VVVPWRPSPDRQPAWDFLFHLWRREHSDWSLTTTDTDGEWCKGRVVANGVRSCGGDVLVISDADVWCTEVGRAVDAVRAGAKWAVPHARILRLTKDASEQVMADGDWSPRGSLERPPHRAVSGGGMVVMRRDVFEACPMPVMGRREDEVWQTQLVPRFGRPWRGTADLFHLWHES